MKNHNHFILRSAVVLLLSILLPASAFSQKAGKQDAKELETIVTNAEGSGHSLTFEFRKGPGHNHPLMAIWIEDLDGNYIQTLYVARSIAKGEFNYGDKTGGKWQPGEILRPAALPYWSHKRNILNDKGNYMPRKGYEVADAYSGATPPADFNLKSRTDNMMNGKFRILIEVNQSWDWNSYWTNNKYPDDKEYKTSSQPAVVYAAVIDPQVKGEKTVLQVIGRSHHAGADGKLYNDLETLTTALQIISSVSVSLD